MHMTWNDLPYLVQNRAKDFGDLSYERENIEVYDINARGCDPEDLWSPAWDRLAPERQLFIVEEIAQEARQQMMAARNSRPDPRFWLELERIINETRKP